MELAVPAHHLRRHLSAGVLSDMDDPLVLSVLRRSLAVDMSARQMHMLHHAISAFTGGRGPGLSNSPSAAPQLACRAATDAGAGEDCRQWKLPCSSPVTSMRSFPRWGSQR